MDRYVVYSAVGEIVPLPLVNVASITGLIVRMVKVLSDHYGVAFEKDRARAIVVGFVAGAMPSGLGSVASSTLTYLMPHSALAGLAVSSVTAAACTRSIGLSSSTISRMERHWPIFAWLTASKSIERYFCRLEAMGQPIVTNGRGIVTLL